MRWTKCTPYTHATQSLPFLSCSELQLPWALDRVDVYEYSRLFSLFSCSCSQPHLWSKGCCPPPVWVWVFHPLVFFEVTFFVVTFSWLLLVIPSGFVSAPPQSSSRSLVLHCWVFQVCVFPWSEARCSPLRTRRPFRYLCNSSVFVIRVCWFRKKILKLQHKNVRQK